MDRAGIAAQCVDEAVVQAVQAVPTLRDGARVTPGPAALIAAVRALPRTGPPWPGPAQAPGLGGVADVLEQQVLPRLLQRHLRSDTCAPDAVPVGARWLAALARAPEDDALHLAVTRLQAQGLTAAAIVRDWLTPAARELGVQWERDECGFADVTIGVGRMHRALHHLESATPLPAMAAPRVLLVLAPGEQHSFGLAVVGAAFRREGWDVVGDGEVSADDAPLCVARDRFDLVGISVGSQATADRVPALCATLRHATRYHSMPILLGGPFVAVGGQMATSDRLGADAVAADVDTALALARCRLPTEPTPFTHAPVVPGSRFDTPAAPRR